MYDVSDHRPPKRPGLPRLAELGRFFAVSVVGLVLDIGLAWTLAVPGGLDLTLAAAAGLAVGAASNYFLHEFWTFRSGARQVSLARAARYGAVLCATFAVRLSVVEGLSRLAPQPGAEIFILVGAAGVSFWVTYLLSRKVFAAAPE